MFPENIFKAYDIRGIYPDELNEDLAYKIGRAYIILRQTELGRKNMKIAIGHDMRLSSPSLFAELKRGLKEQGADVVDIGLVSTPTYYFAVSFYNYDGGLLISASHNPKEYNGIKIVREKAKPLGNGTGMEELKEIVKKGEFLESDYLGTEETNENVLEDETVLCEKYSDLIKIKPMKIVIDTANSMGIVYLERLFKDLPQLTIIKMNDKLDGTFPAHQADPLQEKNIKDLEERVITEKADLGIATDGDGDRIFFVDNLGKRIRPEIMRGILAQTFLKDNPGATICYDIRPGKITEDMILEAGGKPSVTKVGHSLIKRQMIETGAVFGGESSGHFFVQFPHGTYEAPMIATLRFLQVISESNLSSADYVKPLDKYFHSGEINFTVSDKERVLEALKIKYADAKINSLDGLTFTYPDFWFNVRASNTEPLLRLNLESTSKELMEEKLIEIKNIIL
ncbi:MAG: Phosphomannomutase [Candidatus Magasanikbacteria bacterium GW2011_GWA2_37_8]|uniref:Phosphomannomutase n=1 Tax=Candidatus Magasanikbacteria bacterium GW2011_GWA2_37_8 TaxID=1619036 RepID=A0A0G0HC77_9BACT|nr:MAG: Phosphomannomutase [Candidatus Magasanikbacteria bacterium GW2011_GWA2_37_8]